MCSRVTLMLFELALVVAAATAREEWKAGKNDKIVNSGYWAPACPSGFEKQWSAQNVASVCFYVGRQKRSWSSARQACSQLASSNSRCHGDLASILNSGESTYVQNMMSIAQLSDHAWIGLNDIYQEGYMRWSDGRSSTYNNFYYGEPNNGSGTGEDCVEMLNGYSGKWNDRNCYDLKHYVCKAYCV